MDKRLVLWNREERRESGILWNREERMKPGILWNTEERMDPDTMEDDGIDMALKYLNFLEFYG
jgi:hypothetical protein